MSPGNGVETDTINIRLDPPDKAGSHEHIRTKSPLARKVNRSPNMPGPSNPFLFVNETSKSPSYKVGYRPDVRSHIRKHVARGLNKRKHSHGEQQVELASGEAGMQLMGNSTRVYDPQSSPTLYCKACGSYVNSSFPQSPPTNEYHMHTRNQMWRALLRLSPREVLGSGRIDPFLTSAETPDATTHELMDLAVNYLIPGLMPDDHPNRSLSLTSTSSRTWVSAAFELPCLFNALLVACSLERDFLRNSTVEIESSFILSKKLLVIQKLNEFISDPKNAARDEVLLTILILASHEAVDAKEEPNKPFNSPLKTMQWLNMYGNCTYAPTHMKALYDIVNSRGGLEVIKLPCMAEMIVLGDTISALNTFSKPTFAPIRVHEAYIALAMEWAKTSPHLPSQVLATSFSRYSEYGISEPLLEILEPLGVTTWAISYHLQGRPAGLTIGEMGRTRTALMKRLLLLPTAEELRIEIGIDVAPLPLPNLYECCRIAAFIFSVAVTFPIPNTFDVLQHYVQLLKAAIEDSDVMSCDNVMVSEIMLWILTLGGIAALDKPERVWFVEQLSRAKEKLNISWYDATRVFKTYLWLESACGAGGLLLWEESKALVSME
ncbi:hypothetical protein BKA61DRAFT_599072 [Leptodontidium sp. MPI-SDFR-AT-0119]|nr:hypothetical protein BKA61DRAFT_599072 [Leptodontidium sp. MPI-SDFR-AT-0119]